ncbi:MAG: FHA domain-containing protein [Candidatus Dormibacteria bacterium]
MANGPGLVFGQLTFPVNKVTNSVGRKDRITNTIPDVDLGTLDQERSVSRRHAELVYDKGTVSVRDIGSTNGTNVNGERLAHQVDRPLKDGDEVAFGAVTLQYTATAEWPEGVEAEWPPEVPEPAPEETMVAAPLGAEETMVAAPGATDETMVAAPGVPEEPMAAAPGATEETMMAPPANPVAEPPPPFVAAPPAAPAEAPAYVACSNHPHLPAVGLCPGCLEPFCVDCLPERADGLMVCNRCEGIHYRLGAAAGPAADQPAGREPAPAAFGAAPAGAPAQGEVAEKKKKWSF